jgi:hypothetical protein
MILIGELKVFIEPSNVKEAVQRSQHQDDGEINRWLLEIFK